MSSPAPKLKYRRFKLEPTSVKLTAEAKRDLCTIKDVLRRESATPLIEVSQSTAIRAALRVYACSLHRLPGRLSLESIRATKETYARKQPTPRERKLL